MKMIKMEELCFIWNDTHSIQKIHSKSVFFFSSHFWKIQFVCLTNNLSFNFHTELLSCIDTNIHYPNYQTNTTFSKAIEWKTIYTQTSTDRHFVGKAHIINSRRRIQLMWMSEYPDLQVHTAIALLLRKKRKEKEMDNTSVSVPIIVNVWNVYE